MIPYWITVLGILGATLVPAYIALYLIPKLVFVPTRYIAAAGAGLTIWFFFDTMGDASALGVNEGFGGGAAHVGLVVAFLAGIAALAMFDYFAVPSEASSVTRIVNPRSLILIPIAVAAVMGIHGLGEGWGFGSAASSTPSTNVVDAFGGLSTVASYLLHKFLEAFIIAAIYSSFVARSTLVKKERWHVQVLGLLFGLTSVIGAALGYYIAFDTTYFFAFGLASALYAALRTAEVVGLKKAVASDHTPVYLGPKIFIALAIGFFLLYFAALLHS